MLSLQKFAFQRNSYKWDHPNYLVSGLLPLAGCSERLTHVEARVSTCPSPSLCHCCLAIPVSGLWIVLVLDCAHFPIWYLCAERMQLSVSMWAGRVCNQGEHPSPKLPRCTRASGLLRGAADAPAGLWSLGALPRPGPARLLPSAPAQGPPSAQGSARCRVWRARPDAPKPSAWIGRTASVRD